MNASVWTVTAVGVYDRGSAGVFTTLEAATAVAERLIADSDGYHDMRIDQVILDEPIPLEPGLLGSASDVSYHRRRPDDAEVIVNRRTDL